MICPSLSGVDLDGNLVKVECLKYECPKYVSIQGVHPQSGEVVDEWKCSDAWMPILMIENTKRANETGAAIESFRNEMVDANNNAMMLNAKVLSTAIENTNKEIKDVTLVSG